MSNAGDVAATTIDAYGLMLNVSATQSGLSGNPDGLTVLTQGVSITGTLTSFFMPGLALGANLAAIEVTVVKLAIDSSKTGQVNSGDILGLAGATI